MNLKLLGFMLILFLVSNSFNIKPSHGQSFFEGLVSDQQSISSAGPLQCLAQTYASGVDYAKTALDGLFSGELPKVKDNSNNNKCQIEFKNCTDEQKKKIQKAHMDAQKKLEKALDELNRYNGHNNDRITEALISVFRPFGNIDQNNQHISYYNTLIRNNPTVIQDLKQDLIDFYESLLDRSNGDSITDYFVFDLEYVCTNIDKCENKCNKNTCFRTCTVADTLLFDPFNQINLYDIFFQKSEDQRSNTIIHEWSHRFDWKNDEAYSHEPEFHTIGFDRQFDNAEAFSEFIDLLF